MFKNIVPAPPCSVTKEFVNYVADLCPEYLKSPSGKVITPAVLFILGFEIDFDGKYNSFYTINDAIVRTKDKPYETYRTTVYNGKVRKELIGWDSFKEQPIYHKTKYHMFETKYANKEILTIGNIPENLIVNIDQIGDIIAYNDGLAKMNKQVDPEKKFRNIVR